MLQKTNLGELSVGKLGLGCMSMNMVYGEGDEEQASATLMRAVELGVTLFDTANGYGGGDNERLLGRVLKDCRDQVTIATKFGIRRTEDATPFLDGHPDRVADRCDESLQRLGFDVIDLYYLHRPDPEVPIEDTVGAMSRLVEAGKVRHLGLCEVSADSLRKAHKIHTITAVQSEYSLWTRDPEEGVLAACAELGVGFVPFSPMGRAMLTGTLKDGLNTNSEKDLRATMPRFQGDNLKANLTLVAELERLADEMNVKPGQLALAWLLSKSERHGLSIVPIPGTKRIQYLEENIAAAELSVENQTIETLDNIFDPSRISGARYGLSWQQSKDTAR